MPKRARTTSDAVRQIMAALPEVEEFVSHGSPTFRVRGRKVFATYTINHHGDGHVALNLMAPPGAQAVFVKMQPRLYFVPPYVGPAAWPVLKSVVSSRDDAAQEPGCGEQEQRAFRFRDFG